MEQISITEEQQAAVCLQQMEEDKLLARRLQAEDDSDIGMLNNSCNCCERHVTVMLGVYTDILQLPATCVFHETPN